MAEHVRPPRLNPPMPTIETEPGGFVVVSYDIQRDMLSKDRHESVEALMADLDERWAALRASIERWASLDHEERLRRLSPRPAERG